MSGVGAITPVLFFNVSSDNKSILMNECMITGAADGASGLCGG